MIFRLAKLAIYGLIGYAAYEFIRGIVDAPSIAQSGGSGGRSQGRPQQEQPEPRRQNFADTGDATATAPDAASSGLIGGSSQPRGQRVETQDADGASIIETVGRGVVTR